MKKVRQGNTLYILQCDHSKCFHNAKFAFEVERVMVSNDPPRAQGVCLVQNGLVPRSQINNIIQHGFDVFTDHRGSVNAITRSRRKANAVVKYLNSLNVDITIE